MNSRCYLLITASLLGIFSTGCPRTTDSAANQPAEQSVSAVAQSALATKLDAEQLLTRAEAAGGYLARSVRDDGSFVYRYDARTGREPSSYNLLRHCGSVWSMFTLYEQTQDPELKASGERALRYIVKTIRPHPEAPEQAVCVEITNGGQAGTNGPVLQSGQVGDVKLGGNALAILALAQYAKATGDTQHLELARGLGNWICATQSSNGEFTVSKMLWPSLRNADMVSQYYPGEAELALVRLYEVDPQEKWLDAAERGMNYLITVRDRHHVFADHWLLYALAELHERRPNQLYIEHIMRIAKYIEAEQHRENVLPQFIGGFYIPPRSTPASCRIEGLAAAYQVIRRHGKPEDAQTIWGILELAVPFVQQMQYNGDETNVADAARSAGGIRGALATTDIRNDYVQHYLSAMLGVRACLIGEANPAH